MKITLNRKTDIALRILAGIGIALIPAALWWLWGRVCGCNILHSHPAISDELGYWRLMYSFSECGLDFGTCGGIINGEPAWGHFGSHGLAPFFAWGWSARLFPWTQESLVQANFIMLEAAYILFALLVHDDLWDMVFSGVVLLCWPYIFLYLCSSMMEIPCCAVMIVYTALFIRYRKKKTRLRFALALSCVIYLTCMRYCYALAAFPLLWERCDYRIDKKTVIVMLFYALGIVFAYWFLTRFEAIYPEYVLIQVDRTDLIGKIQLLWENFVLNVQKYFSFQNHETSEFFQRIISVVIAALLCIRGLFGENRRFYFSLGLTVFGLILLNLICYDIGYQKEYRVMGPMLVFVLLAVSNGKGSLWLKTVLALSAAAGLVIGVKQIRGYGSRNEYNSFFLPNRFSEIADVGDAVRACFGEEKASFAIKVSESFETVVWVPPQIGVQWALGEEALKDAHTEYIISMAEPPIVPDNYTFVGEPMPQYKVFRRND